MISNSNDKILTEREVCNWLGVSEPTLFRHRRDGTGPKFIRLSARRVGYRHSAVEAWLSKREQHSPLHSDACHRPRDPQSSGQALGCRRRYVHR
jgi:predicted DNA-binding transcriptional regulator AlpA